jgi:hypothetical protein
MVFGIRSWDMLARVIRHLWHRRHVLGARVDKERAEALRKILASEGLVDKSRHIAEDGQQVVIPLLHEPREQVLRSHGAVLVRQSGYPTASCISCPRGGSCSGTSSSSDWTIGSTYTRRMSRARMLTS